MSLASTWLTLSTGALAFNPGLLPFRAEHKRGAPPPRSRLRKVDGSLLHKPCPCPTWQSAKRPREQEEDRLQSVADLPDSTKVQESDLSPVEEWLEDDFLDAAPAAQVDALFGDYWEPEPDPQPKKKPKKPKPQSRSRSKYGPGNHDYAALEAEAQQEAEEQRLGAEPWAGGMTMADVPDDGRSGYSGRDLEDMLMERSLRFYDPKVVGEREKCFLVGLEVKEEYGPGGAASDNRFRRQSGEVDYEAKERAALAKEQEREDQFTLEESLTELSELAGTAGLEVVGSTYQRVAEPNARTYLGAGKVKEIKRAMNALGCCTVILDEELQPGQQRNLEVEFGGEEAGIKVLDRTALILDIFAQHARTREGQLQVELALHMYRLPRLTKLWTHLERQSSGGKSGGVGLRGPGEKQLEVDRRILNAKIAQLQKEILGIKRHRDLHRRRRHQLGLPIIALVGYTNAGKSTVLNGLTRAGVLAENMLFATLDPTTRRVRLPGMKVHPEVMLTDTVGFVQKLPTNLVAAFRATLEEVVEADVIVHVCDISAPNWQKQKKAVLKVLGDMEVADKPILTLWNKLDMLPRLDQDRVQYEASATQEWTVAASAMTGKGMEDFVLMLEDALATLLYPVEAVVPYGRGDLMSRVHELGACDMEEHTPEGTMIQARVPTELLNRLEPYYTERHRARAAQARLDSRSDMGQDFEQWAVDPSTGIIGAGVKSLEEDLEEQEVDWAAIAKGRHKR